MRRARRSLLAGPLAPTVGCLLLGAALYHQLTLPETAEIEVPVAAATGDGGAEPPPVGELFVLPPLATFAEVVERPLFSPTRRPVTAEPAIVEAAPAPETLDVTVVGIITGPRKLALLRSPNSSQLLPLAEGDSLGGWTLTEIEPFRLLFRREDDRQTVEIEYRGD